MGSKRGQQSYPLPVTKQASVGERLIGFRKGNVIVTGCERANNRKESVTYKPVLGVTRVVMNSK